jgi:hypothetical protein
MTLVLDAGAFVALERGDLATWERLRNALDDDDPPVSHGGVVAQVWRGSGPRQALLARALSAVDVVPLDEELGRRAGVLLARSGGRDGIDAAVVALARDGDIVVTSDQADIAVLVVAARRRIEVVAA